MSDPITPDGQAEPVEPGESLTPANAAPVSVEQANEKLPGTPDSEGWRKLHPLSPILRGGLFLLVLVGIIIANFRDRFVQIFVSGGDDGFEDTGDIVDLYEYLVAQGLVLVAIGVIFGIVLLVVLFSWIAWRFQTYRVTADSVESRSGVIFRQHRRAPLDRVQSVNLQRPLVARLVGVTKVEIVTAGQGGKVDLAYLGHRNAKTVREQIIRLAAAKRQGDAVDQPIDQITGAPPASFDSTQYAEPHDTLTQRAQDFADFDIDPEAAAAQSLVRVPAGRLAAAIALQWESVIAFVLLVLVLIWVGVSAVIGVARESDGFFAIAGVSLLSIVPILIVLISVMFSQFNKSFNFTLSRGRDAVRTGSGLTSTNTDSIPFGRVHAIQASQPLLWRKLGWWRVKVTLAGHSLAQGGQNATQNVVLPVGTEEDVMRVMDTLLPGTTSDLFDGLSGPGEGYIGAGPKAGWVLWFGRRRAGIRLDEHTLRMRRGFLTRSLSIMPIVRAQSVMLHRPMWHYWLKLARIQAHTVLGPVNMVARGIALADAQRFFDDLTAAVLRVQGDESSELLALREGKRPTE